MRLREFEDAAEQLANATGVSLEVARRAIYQGDSSLLDQSQSTGRKLQRLDARVRQDEARERAFEEELGDAWEDFLENEPSPAARQMSAEEEHDFAEWADLCRIEAL